MTFTAQVQTQIALAPFFSMFGILLISGGGNGKPRAKMTE